MEELVGLRKNILLQISRLKKIPKISASVSQPKSCKNDAHDEILTCKEGEGAEELAELRKNGLL